MWCSIFLDHVVWFSSRTGRPTWNSSVEHERGPVPVNLRVVRKFTGPPQKKLDFYELHVKSRTSSHYLSNTPIHQNYGGTQGEQHVVLPVFMMTSSNGNIFRVTGPLCGEFTSHQWMPHTNAVTRSFGVFSDLSLNQQLSKQWDAGDLRRHRPHYDVTLMRSFRAGAHTN